MLLLVLFAGTAAGEGLSELVSGGKVGLDLRYRFENVEQADKASTAGASTLRVRFNLATGKVRGFSGAAF